MGWPCSV